MDLEPYLDRIRSEFPEVKFRDVTIPKQGLDHLALFLDDKWVFRFAKNPEYIAHFPNEVRLLNELQEHISLPIPHYQYISADSSFGGYALIQGEQLWPDLFRSLTTKAKEQIVSEVATFLTELHAFPSQRATELGVNTHDPIADQKTVQEEYERYTKNRLTVDEQKQCEGIFQELQKCFGEKHPIVLTHHDLLSEHILIRALHDRLAGIIDFGDKSLFDPAADFTGLWDFGESFIRTVYERYEGQKDDTFLPRSLLYFKNMSLKWIAAEIKEEYWGFEKTYQHFQEALKIQFS